MNTTKISAVLILLSISFYAGWSHRAGVAKLDAAQFAKQVEEYETALQNKVDKVEEVAQVAVNEQVVVTKYVTKEVIKYVKNNTDVCELNDDWVRIHNTASAGRVPDTTETTVVPYDTTDAIATVAENYGNCRDTIERLNALQSWVAALRN